MGPICSQKVLWGRRRARFTWSLALCQSAERPRPQGFYRALLAELLIERFEPMRRSYGDDYVVDESILHATAEGHPFGLEGRGRPVRTRFLHIRLQRRPDQPRLQRRPDQPRKRLDRPRRRPAAAPAFEAPPCWREEDASVIDCEWATPINRDGVCPLRPQWRSSPSLNALGQATP